MRATMARTSWCAAILVLIISSWVNALGPLVTAPGAIIQGSTIFTDGANISGHVDWAVFNNTPGSFPYSGGYSPSAGEYAYAYQIFVDAGSAQISSFAVAMNGPADNIGNFTDLGGVAPISQVLISGDSAKWTFSELTEQTNSRGLVFSSPERPETTFGSVIDHGATAFVIPLYSPQSHDVPEPATAGLVMLGCAMLGFRRSR